MKRVVIVGGGISGLATAWRLALGRPDLDITVVEALARFGGKLITEGRDGFLVEAAADGFLARKPPALAWSGELGADLVEPRPEHRFSHVWWEGGLHRMPEGFSGLVPADPDAMRSGSLLTSAGIDRIAAEAAVPLQAGGPEESITQFFTRRFGGEAFERLMEPLLAGIFAGDSNLLSAEAAFPHLVALERGGSSLMQGMAANQSPPDGSAPVGPAFRSFAGGMAGLPAALVEAATGLGVHLVAGSPIKGIDRSDSGFLVRSAHGIWPADAVIVALPPRAAGAVLARMAPAQAAVLSAWPTSSVANLSLAFDAAELPGLPAGSGFVAPRNAGSRFSAATWSSQKWPGRAPDGAFLLRFYAGGARDPAGWQTPEAILVAAALDLLAGWQGGRRPRPLWQRVFRWPDAFAQPDLGHAGRHQALAATAVDGMFLAGGYFAGVGIPDCLARAGDVAEATIRYLG